MQGGFGRKGLDQHGGGTIAASQGFGQARTFGAGRDAPSPDAEPDVSPELRAFLASERANRGPEPGLSDLARRRTEPAPRAPAASGAPAKSMILAYVLWYFGAAIAAHRFYLGVTGSALAMTGLFWGGLALMLFLPPLGLLMLAGWLLWVLADLFLIPRLVRDSAGEDRVAAIFG